MKTIYLLLLPFLALTQKVSAQITPPPLAQTQIDTNLQAILATQLPDGTYVQEAPLIGIASTPLPSPTWPYRSEPQQ